MAELTAHDIYLFKEGAFFRAYEKLGAHPQIIDGRQGTRFAVWAPNAQAVSVVGDFNNWEGDRHALRPRWDQSGIWELFVPDVGAGAVYKYHLRSRHEGYRVDKADPFAF